MPRRNRREESRTRYDEPSRLTVKPATTEDLARSLVRRGLCSSLILDHPHLAQKVTTP